MYRVYVGGKLYAQVGQQVCLLGKCGNCISCVQMLLRAMRNTKEMHFEEVRDVD
jgi:hypothetical protein